MRKRLLSLFIVLTMIASLIIVPATIVNAATLSNFVASNTNGNPGQFTITYDSTANDNVYLYVFTDTSVKWGGSTIDDYMTSLYNPKTSGASNKVDASGGSEEDEEAKPLYWEKITGTERSFNFTPQASLYNASGETFWIVYNDEVNSDLRKWSFDVDSDGTVHVEKTHLTVNWGSLTFDSMEYDGGTSVSADKVNGSISFDGVPSGSTVTPVVTYTRADKNAGSKAVTATVALSDDDAKTYDITGDTSKEVGNITVEKANYTYAATPTASVAIGTAANTKVEIPNVTIVGKVAADNKTGKLTANTTQIINEGVTDNVTWEFEGTIDTVNYNPFSKLGTISAAAKTEHAVNITANDIKYGTAAFNATVTVAGLNNTDYTVKYYNAAGTEVTEPGDVGQYKVKVELTDAAAAANTLTGTTEKTFNVTAKALTLNFNGITITKVYDGTKTATAPTFTAANLTNLKAGDDVTVTATNAAYQYEVVSSRNNVTMNVALGGTKAGNYTIAPTATVAGSITARPITVAMANKTTKEYGQNLNGQLPAENYTVGNAVTGKDPQLSFSANGGLTAAGPVGTYNVTVTCGNANYSLAATTLTDALEVVKATPNKTKAPRLLPIPAGAKVSTANFAGEAKFENPYTHQEVTGTMSIADSDKELTFATEGEQTINVVFTPTDTTNYNVVNTTAKINISSKPGVVVTVAPKTVTYDGTAKAIDAPTVKLNNADVTGANVTIEYKPEGAADTEYSATAPKNAGIYDVRVVVADSATYAGTGANGVTTKLTISKLALGAADIDVTGVTAQKVYDTLATVTPAGTVAVTGKTGDTLTIDLTKVTAVFTGGTGKNVGENKEVELTIPAAALGGASAANYMIDGHITKTINTGKITPVAITINAIEGIPSKLVNASATEASTGTGVFTLSAANATGVLAADLGKVALAYKYTYTADDIKAEGEPDVDVVTTGTEGDVALGLVGTAEGNEAANYTFTAPNTAKGKVIAATVTGIEVKNENKTITYTYPDSVPFQQKQLILVAKLDNGTEERMDVAACDIAFADTTIDTTKALPVGDYSVTLTYKGTNLTDTLTIKVLPKQIVVPADLNVSISKVNGSATVNSEITIKDGVAVGDDVVAIEATNVAFGTDATVGIEETATATLALTGANAGNYTLVDADGNAITNPVALTGRIKPSTPVISINKEGKIEVSAAIPGYPVEYLVNGDTTPVTATDGILDFGPVESGKEYTVIRKKVEGSPDNLSDASNAVKAYKVNVYAKGSSKLFGSVYVTDTVNTAAKLNTELGGAPAKFDKYYTDSACTAEATFPVSAAEGQDVNLYYTVTEDGGNTPIVTPPTPGRGSGSGILMGGTTTAGDYKHSAYVNGYPDGSFRAEGAITRAEAAAIFARAVVGGFNSNQTYSNPYSDVNSGAWYANYVGFLASKGIVKGYEDGAFYPEQTITRQEYAAMIARLGAVAQMTNSPFSDVSSANWGANEIYTVQTKGLIEGYPDGTFRPDNSITRAEAVRITNKYLNRGVDKIGLSGLDDYNKFNDLTTAHWAYYDIIEAANNHTYSSVKNPERWDTID